MNTRAAIGALAASALLIGVSACSDDTSDTTAPPKVSENRGIRRSTTPWSPWSGSSPPGRGITPMPRTPHVRPALVRLGQALAFDKILSGNRDISCMTCHLPGFATGDGRSLSIGQGGTGLGPDRVHPDGAFIPRNAPAVFNIFDGQSAVLGRAGSRATGRATSTRPPGGASRPEHDEDLRVRRDLRAAALSRCSAARRCAADKGNELAAIARRPGAADLGRV